MLIIWWRQSKETYSTAHKKLKQTKQKLSWFLEKVVDGRKQILRRSRRLNKLLSTDHEKCFLQFFFFSSLFSHETLRNSLIAEVFCALSSKLSRQFSSRSLSQLGTRWSMWPKLFYEDVIWDDIFHSRWILMAIEWKMERKQTSGRMRWEIIDETFNWTWQGVMERKFLHFNRDFMTKAFKVSRKAWGGENFQLLSTLVLFLLFHSRMLRKKM